MKVGFFLFYPGTLWTPGGGESLVRTLYTALESLGIDVELFDIWNPGRYDIIHVFGSSYQMSDFVVAAKHNGERVIVSTIAYSVRPPWQWKVWNIVDKCLPVPTAYTYRRRIYNAADVLLPSSLAEAEQLGAHFGISNNKFVVIPFASEERFAKATPDLFVETYNLNDFILMVARINSIKGQIRLMNALDGHDIPIVFIGGSDPQDSAYYGYFLEECRKRPTVHYLGSIPHDSEVLPSAFAAAKVHALASLNEYPGLANIEAGLAGANVVSLKSPIAYEYFGDGAIYCNPRSLSSIRKAVLSAYHTPRNGLLRQRLLSTVTPEIVATKIKSVYVETLERG